MTSRLDPVSLNSLRTLLPADSLLIVTAHIDRQAHLQSGSAIPVEHAVERLDDALASH
ncbi:MAG: hypothetical protein ACYCY9_03895 [Thiobacillus sp.]